MTTSEPQDDLAIHQEQLDDEMCTWPSGRDVYTRANDEDQWPRPITPLTQELVQCPQEAAFTRVYADELKVMPDEGPWMWRGVFYGWTAFRVEPAAQMTDRLPGWSRTGLYADYFGVTEDPNVLPPAAAPGLGVLGLGKLGVAFAQALRSYPRRIARFTAQAHARLRTDLTRDWAAVDDQELVDRLRAHHAEAVEYFRPHVLAGTLPPTFVKAVHDAAAKFAGDEAPALVTAALTGLGGIHMQEATRAAEQVAAGTMTRETFLDLYGFRGFNEFELATGPWRDNPQAIDALVAAAGSERTDRATAGREAARARLRTLAGSRWIVFSRQLATAEKHMRLRENGKVPSVMATHSIRLVVREAARRLVERGRLAAVDDVFFLRRAELLDELCDMPAPDLAAIVARRRRTHELAAEFPIPEMFDAMPGRIETISRERWRQLGVRPPQRAVHDDRLEGLGGSPGRVTGRARIVRDPLDVELSDGDIIVARGTDSAWTALFYQADGVVVDVGGPLSHSSIAAREMGIPCVVNVKTGTTRITEGQKITVDGGTGVVELH